VGTISRGIIVVAPPHAAGPVVIDLTDGADARVRLADTYVYAGADCVPAEFPPPRPVDAQVASGASRFEVHPLGTPPFHFEWYRGPTGDIATSAGAEPFLLLPRQGIVPASSNGQYWVRVRNDCGEAARGFSLRVLPGRIAPR
jgi:hypothetical protein